MSRPDESQLIDEILAVLGTGTGQALRLSDGGLSIHLPGVIPTGSPWLDWALGRGGWPLSRTVLVGGDEGAGKTTLGLMACASVQAMGGVAFYLDAEYKLDAAYADILGVDVDSLIMSQPLHMENMLERIEAAIKVMMKMTARTGVRIPCLIVADSISAIPPKAELEGDYDQEGAWGLAARTMAKGLRKLSGLVSKADVCLMLISQLRVKIGAHGDDLNTSCGKAPLYHACTIVRLNRGTRVKEGTQSVGTLTRCFVHKNGVGPPHRRSELMIEYGQGIDQIHGLHHAAIQSGWASTSGSWTLPPAPYLKWKGPANLPLVNDAASVEAAIRASYGAISWDE